MRHDWEAMRQGDNTKNVVDMNDESAGFGGFGGASEASSVRGRSNKRGGNQSAAGSVPGNKAGANKTAQAAVNVNRKADWEQFYDENAKAKYWFNSKTGEASWTTPNFT
jgi:hypothetical protein